MGELRYMTKKCIQIQTMKYLETQVLQLVAMDSHCEIINNCCFRQATCREG